MIEIDFVNNVYVCPYCGLKQVYVNSHSFHGKVGAPGFQYSNDKNQYSYLDIYHIKCSNKQCQKITVVGSFCESKEQVDILPPFVCKQFPDYIPQQIRNDYEEACLILRYSPKAAATLLRRCLQGMIRDFWNIKGDNLYQEISKLKGRVSDSQWEAIDALRQIGNIGAHMEKDANMIIEIEADSAQKLQKLIELLLEKWYVARYEDENLFSEVVNISEEKRLMRKR